jgi:hypothetical protein
MPYSFDWAVKDEPSYNDYSHQQSSDGKVVTGSYRVALPDGRTQIVTYKADEYGYVADVKYEGEAKYDEYKPAYKPAATYSAEPAYSKPAYPAEPAAYSEPAYTKPAYPETTYPEPAYSEPAYTKPAYPKPAYPEPAYPKPAYPEPAYTKPAYPEPAYPKPAYPEPAYAKPAYAEPTYPSKPAY